VSGHLTRPHRTSARPRQSTPKVGAAVPTVLVRKLGELQVLCLRRQKRCGQQPNQQDAVRGHGIFGRSTKEPLENVCEIVKRRREVARERMGPGPLQHRVLLGFCVLASALPGRTMTPAARMAPLANHVSWLRVPTVLWAHGSGGRATSARRAAARFDTAGVRSLCSSAAQDASGSQNAARFKLFYNDVYEVPLPENHRFPMGKYRQVREKLQADPALDNVDFHVSPLASGRDLRTTHCKEYISRFLCNMLTPQGLPTATAERPPVPEHHGLPPRA
jgi:hypothetical protein